jgi:hypothetical protein
LSNKKGEKMSIKTNLTKTIIGITTAYIMYACGAHNEKLDAVAHKKEIPFDSIYSSRFSFWQKEFALPIDTIVEDHFGVYGLSKNKSIHEYDVLQYIPYMDIQDTDKVKGMILLKNCNESYADSLRKAYNSVLITKTNSTTFNRNLEWAIEGSKQTPAKK